MILKYNSSVKTPAGWRNVEITATAERVSKGMALVTHISAIDGKPLAYDMTRTGARRQEFNGHFWAARQVGTMKRISACTEVQP
jgi:hypothetical protein